MTKIYYVKIKKVDKNMILLISKSQNFISTFLLFYGKQKLVSPDKTN